MRLDPRLTWDDIDMRMEYVGARFAYNHTIDIDSKDVVKQALKAKSKFCNALQTKCSRGRVAFKMLSWRERQRTAKSRDDVLRQLSANQIANNTTRGSTPGIINPLLPDTPANRVPRRGTRSQPTTPSNAQFDVQPNSPTSMLAGRQQALPSSTDAAAPPLVNNDTSSMDDRPSTLRGKRAKRNFIDLTQDDETNSDAESLPSNHASTSTQHAVTNMNASASINRRRRRRNSTTSTPGKSAVAPWEEPTAPISPTILNEHKRELIPDDGELALQINAMIPTTRPSSSHPTFAGPNFVHDTVLDSPPTGILNRPPPSSSSFPFDPDTLSDDETFPSNHASTSTPYTDTNMRASGPNAAEPNFWHDTVHDSPPTSILNRTPPLPNSFPFDPIPTASIPTTITQPLSEPTAPTEQESAAATDPGLDPGWDVYYRDEDLAPFTNVGEEYLDSRYSGHGSFPC